MVHLSGASFLHLDISGGEKQSNLQKTCKTRWLYSRRGCKIQTLKQEISRKFCPCCLFWFHPLPRKVCTYLHSPAAWERGGRVF